MKAKTLAEKVFDAHVIDTVDSTQIVKVDKVFCHEITTPIAIKDLEARSLDRVFDPEKIKVVIDHVSPAKDSQTAIQGQILRAWATRHQIKDFFEVGRNGVCHALFPEKGFVRPGQIIIMGDSHTCTLGAFGALGVGVGTTDLEVGLLKGIVALNLPPTIKVVINGPLAPGVTAKDVALFLIAKIGMNGATGRVIEYSGPVVKAMSMAERMTICNMAVEAGATTGICGPDQTTVDYLWPFIQSEFKNKEAALRAYQKWCSDPGAVYETTVNLTVDTLKPLATFGAKPDQSRPAREMSEVKVDQVYIGSCTNGRLEDLRQAAKILHRRKIASTVRAILCPATAAVYQKALKEGILATFIDAGFCVISPGCGACLGMSNGILAPGEVCAATTNRNFSGRMGKGGQIHLVSPATAAATAVTGRITDAAELENGF